VCLPFAPTLLSEAADAPASSIVWEVYLGVFPTAIAFTTYAYALKTMSASNLGVTTYLVPPITIVLGVIFLSEAPPGIAYVGGALALVGVAVARRKPRTLATTGPTPA
jgi:drug/metabolite transporter (DMT)-like permease